MVNLNDVNIEEAAEPKAFGALDGWFAMAPVDFEERESKAGNTYLHVVMEIYSDDHPELKGVTARKNFNYKHPTDKVRSIALGQLKELSIACTGEWTPDTDDIRGRVCDVRLRPQKDNDQFHEPVKFEPYGSRTGNKKNDSKPSATAAPSGGKSGAAPTWMKK